MNTRKNRHGFTLIEALIAIVLLGMAIAALVAANGALTSASGAGLEISTAQFLLEQVREMTAALPAVDPTTGSTTFGPETGETLATYDDIDDFTNATFCPPIDGARAQCTAYSAYTQQIKVEKVLASDMITTTTDASDFFRVTVKVSLNGKDLAQASWIRAKL